MAEKAQAGVEGLHLRPEVMESLLADCEARPEQLRQLALDTDLRKAGAGSLPDDINRMPAGTLQGPLVLQIAAVDDVARPLQQQQQQGGGGAGAGPGERMLRLKLTDGRLDCSACEWRPVPQINSALPPGTKIRVAGVGVRQGVLLLEPGCVEVLGGSVEALLEAWETQRRYGGLERPLQEDGEPGAGMDPPAFSQFRAGEPQRTRSGRRAPSERLQPGAPGFGVSEVLPGMTHQAAEQMVAEKLLGAKGGVTAEQEAEAAQRSVREKVALPQAAAPTSGGSVARQKLHDLMEGKKAAEASGERGRGRGRRGRRGRAADGEPQDGGGRMTLEEWEEMQKAQRAAAPLRPPASPVAAPARSAESDPERRQQEEEDWQLAMELQRQMDLEEEQERSRRELASNLFSYGPSDGHSDGGPARHGGRGGRRGGGRGRGGGRRGRGGRHSHN